MNVQKSKPSTRELPPRVVDRLLKLRAHGKLDMTVLTPNLRAQILEREAEKREHDSMREVEK
jgi:hypothetical protein